MEKMNKVIRGLECCLSDADCDKCCPYFKGDGCMDEMMADALEILRGDSGDWIRLSDLMKFPIRIDHYDKEHGNEHFVYGVETVLEYAEYLPRVEAEPVVHAHWICDCEPYHICSNCRHKFSLFDRVPRCPNCGAHMDEELRTGYCPLCDKHFEIRSNESHGHCPDCGHHVVLRIEEASR